MSEVPPQGPAAGGWQPPPHGPVPPGQLPPAGWGQPFPWPPPPPRHPDANAALVWGIVALAGGMSMCLPLLVSPFAWFYGARVVREIEQSPQPLGGLSEAKAGKVMGIVGSCLLGVALLGLVLLIGLAVLSEAS
ncbi:hypothetical protein NODU109028_12275 [Nocardioides dubius]|uniref:DUF4190 domain-containing protein n=1 Tax=Nocardioides dubius TaxID=317019 RepID=A0ABN1TR96_9ACTN